MGKLRLTEVHTSGRWDLNPGLSSLRNSTSTVKKCKFSRNQPTMGVQGITCDGWMMPSAVPGCNRCVGKGRSHSFPIVAGQPYGRNVGK